MSLVSLDGTIGPAADARVPLLDDGLLRGDGIFEALRLYAGRPFALDAHLERLSRSGAGLRLAFDPAALRAEIGVLLAQAGAVDGILRVVLTRGGRRIVLIEPLPSPPGPASVMTVTYAPNRVLDGLKTLSYAANMLAKRLAQEAGHDEALFVTPHGRVLEGPTWSFFWVRDGRLLTPPLQERILASITRAHVIAACDVEEATCTVADLAAAEEAFIASTVREVVPIAALDGRTLPAAPGPVTTGAASRLRARIEAELAVAAG